ncbi:MAG: hypothetical protein AAFV77_02235, partial [Planctomycetota bacterium]
DMRSGRTRTVTEVLKRLKKTYGHGRADNTFRKWRTAARRNLGKDKSNREPLDCDEVRDMANYLDMFDEDRNLSQALRGVLSEWDDEWTCPEDVAPQN